jgi:serine/threonine protein kinase
MSLSRRKPLSLNMSLINEMDDDVHQNLGLVGSNDDDDDDGDDIFRENGLSIGRDFLRIQGSTMSQLHPQSLDMEHTLGRGACSRVVKAMLHKTTPVALKQIPLNSPDKQMMLSKELQVFANMDCDCLVKLFGAFLEFNTVTLVLEYMDRGCLESLLLSLSPGGLPEAVSAAIAYQTLWGLSYLHYEHRLHRDIKPANILLHRDGSVKLSDFGISAVMETLHSMNTTVVGTTKYMSLERLRGKPYSQPSDVWSFGLVLLHCVTGKFVFADVESVVELVVTLEEMEDHADDDDATTTTTTHESFVTRSLGPDGGSESLRQLLEGCLQLQPEKRMPAHILVKSPWFASQGIQSLDEARAVVCDYLANSN